MKEKKSFHIGTGITSLLMIFVVLCLTTFGILSYSSANAEYTLTKKNADYVTNYYSVYSMGAEALAKIDRILYQERSTEETKSEEYLSAVENKLKEIKLTKGSIEITRESNCLYVTYLCEITNGQDLKLDILINDKKDSQRYKVTSCFVKSEIGEMSYEEELPDMWGE